MFFFLLLAGAAVGYYAYTSRKSPSELRDELVSAASAAGERLGDLGASASAAAGDAGERAGAEVSRARKAVS